MDSEGSITLLIARVVEDGDEQAAQQIVDRYFNALMRVAKKKLGGAPRAVEDEEDVVISALDSFIQRAHKQAFPQLKDRYNLWPLLLKITERKAINQRKRQLAMKRGGGKVLDERALGRPHAEGEPGALIDIPSPDPTPQSYAEFKEQCRNLFDSLENDLLRMVASLKLEGHSNAEIAQQLGVVERTVQRKLKLIRDQWKQKLS